MNSFVEEFSRTVLKADGTKEEKSFSLMKEHKMTININGKMLCSLVCTNEMLKELVVGRLVTTGYIQGIEHIEDITFDFSSEVANVTLKNLTEKGLTKNELKKVSSIDWKKEDIFSLAKKFSEGMPLHTKTQGTHSCLLAKGEDVLFMCEDIGRHNTVDKAVGFSKLSGINLSECTLYISGRVPVDMMQKVIYSGIPVLVSKAVPTADSVRLAKKYGVTLIVKAYPDQIEICD